MESKTLKKASVKFTTVKKISFRFTKEEVRQLEFLIQELNEKQTQIIKRALNNLYREIFSAKNKECK